MSSLNKVILIGNLGRDPELKDVGSNKVCSFSLATKEKFKDQEKTEWHNIVAWNKLAEICSQYLSKCRQVYIEGRLQTRQWEKDGVKRNVTEIVATNVIFLGDGKREQKPEPKKDEFYFGPAPMDNDTPF